MSGVLHAAVFPSHSNYVLNLKEDISDGIGAPDWRLTLCLLFSWVVIFFTLAWGVKSSGKVRSRFSQRVKLGFVFSAFYIIFLSNIRPSLSSLNGRLLCFLNILNPLLSAIFVLSSVPSFSAPYVLPSLAPYFLSSIL